MDALLLWFLYIQPKDQSCLRKEDKSIWKDTIELTQSQASLHFKSIGIFEPEEFLRKKRSLVWYEPKKKIKIENKN